MEKSQTATDYNPVCKSNNEEDVTEDETECSADPEIDLSEPEPDDKIMLWAERNIAENPSIKIELIEELRNLIFERGECEPHRTDDAFLLRFLRARHFIVRMAHRLLVNYYEFRETHPQLFYNVDFQKIVDIGDAEIFNVPPYTDDVGRRMIFIRIENWNTSQFTTDELFQAIIFLIQTAILEPRHQILGGVVVFDVKNLSTGHAWYLSTTVVKQMLAVAYNSLPHRLTAIHIINASKVFDYVYAIFKPFLSDFMKDRIFIHQNDISLHEHISPKYLPKRYGGVRKDYLHNNWLNVLKNRDDLLEEIESTGYENIKEFIKNI